MHGQQSIKKKSVGEDLNILENDAVPLRHIADYQNILILCNNHHSKKVSRCFELQLRELHTFGTHGTTHQFQPLVLSTLLEVSRVPSDGTLLDLGLSQISP
jgi:hypothetical protein